MISDATRNCLRKFLYQSNLFWNIPSLINFPGMNDSPISENVFIFLDRNLTNNI